MMGHPNAPITCCVTGCGKPSRGNFCMDCWALLPWDIKGAMGRARKKNHSTKDATKHAKEFLERQRGTGNVVINGETVKVPPASVTACRAGDRAMLATPEGKALVAAAVTAMNADPKDAA